MGDRIWELRERKEASDHRYGELRNILAKEVIQRKSSQTARLSIPQNFAFGLNLRNILIVMTEVTFSSKLLLYFLQLPTVGSSYFMVSESSKHELFQGHMISIVTVLGYKIISAQGILPVLWAYHSIFNNCRCPAFKSTKPMNSFPMRTVKTSLSVIAIIQQHPECDFIFQCVL